MADIRNDSGLTQILIASLIIGGAIYFFGQYKKEENVRLVFDPLNPNCNCVPEPVMVFEQEEPQIFPESMLQHWDNTDYQFASLT